MPRKAKPGPDAAPAVVQVKPELPPFVPSAGPAAPLSGAVFSDPLIRLCTALLLCVVAWQVFSLGFYLDDWPFIVKTSHAGAALSWERWHASRMMSLPRPGLTPLWYVLLSFLGHETILWHLALFLANALLAGLVYRIARQLSGEWWNLSTARCCFFSVLLWFVLPWNATFHFWPTDVPVLLIWDLFAGCLLLTLRRWQRGRLPFVACTIGYLWACVGYEAVYFQWIPLVLLALVWVASRRLTLKRLIIGACPFLIAQFCALIWLTISLRINQGTQNNIVPEWPKVFLANLGAVPSEVLRSTQETKWEFAAAATLWIAVAATIYVKALRGVEERQRALISLGQVAACVSGALISIGAFSLGGRPVSGTGVDARSLLGFNFWLIAGFVLANALCWSLARGIFTTLLRVAGIGVAVTLGTAHLQRGFDWADAGREQQKILAEAPIDGMKRMEPNATVLYVNRQNVNGAPIFGAPWDINAAMLMTHPVTNGHEFVPYNPWLGPLKWNGDTLAYESLKIKQARDLYVWLPSSRDFYKATKPFRVDQLFAVHESNQ